VEVFGVAVSLEGVSLVVARARIAGLVSWTVVDAADYIAG
jgi:hypothetical protein